MSGAIACACLAAALVANPWHSEVSRLVGQRVAVDANGYQILDVAGEGAPRVGCIRARGTTLFFAEEDGRPAVALLGPLAVPRIAGPNYKVWLLGDDEADGLRVRRLGILRSPSEGACPSPAGGPGSGT